MLTLSALLLALTPQSISSVTPGPGGLGTVPHRPVVEAGLTVFLADRVTDGAFEVWASRLDGSAPWRVSGDLPPGGNLLTFWVAPDGKHVAYQGYQEAVNDFALYVAPIDGSSYVRASQVGDKLQITSQDRLWSPDGQWVAYTSKPGSITDLWVVRNDGTQRRNLSSIAIPLGDVNEFGWSPDSTRIAFQADRTVLDRVDLYTATPDGLELDMVHPVPSDDSMDMDRFLWSPDGSQIACVGDQFVVGQPQVFVALPTGAGYHSVTVSHILPGAQVQQLEWTPDGTRLVLVSNAQSSSVLELWIVDQSGGGWLRLNGPLGSGGNVSEFRIAPDGSRVAYRADQIADGRPELFTTMQDGSGNVAISGPFVSGGAVALPGVFFWSPDSAHVAYLADQLVDNRTEVFVSQPDGSGNLKVSGGLFPTASNQFGLTGPWSPDATRLAYSASNFGLHPISVRPDGSGTVAITGPIVAGGGSGDAIWSDSTPRVVYRASQNVAGVLELFASDPDGANNQLLSGSMIATGDVGAVVVH